MRVEALQKAKPFTSCVGDTVMVDSQSPGATVEEMLVRDPAGNPVGGLKMANGLIELAGGYMLPTLFFTMVTSLILGMGVPTTANYVITATMAAPALVMLAVPKLAAHLFVFYFGIIADITPPELRGAAFGLRQSLDTVGAFLGPLLAMGLMLLWANDFRAVFWVAVIPGLLAVALLAAFADGDRSEAERMMRNLSG